MKKQEYDSIEKVFSKKLIPNAEEVDHTDNKNWWKEVWCETDEESKRSEMVEHEIAFDGTKPLEVRKATREKSSLFKNENFTARYKMR